MGTPARWLHVVCSAAIVAVLLLKPVTAADVEHGKQVFLACAACHTGKPDAIGPNLKGVFGRRSGSVEGYRYSAAMQRASLTWDEANLRDYIANPQAKVKGNRMPYAGLKNPQDVDDVIAYLKAQN